METFWEFLGSLAPIATIIVGWFSFQTSKVSAALAREARDTNILFEIKLAAFGDFYKAFGGYLANKNDDTRGQLYSSVGKAGVLVDKDMQSKLNGILFIIESNQQNEKEALQRAFQECSRELREYVDRITDEIHNKG